MEKIKKQWYNKKKFEGGNKVEDNLENKLINKKESGWLNTDEDKFKKIF